jgi:hypothetical protein
LLGAALFLGLVTAGFFYFLMAAVAVFDAYRVGRALKEGRPVRKWQFFP